METVLELLSTAGRFLVGLWPVMFVMLLVGIFKRHSTFGIRLRVSIKALIIAWVFFAILRAVFFFLRMDTFQLLAEPMNSKLFLSVGLFLLPLLVAILLEERHKRFTANSLEEMRSLSAPEFEELVANTYRDQGHHVELVGSPGDHGIDLIVHTRKGETWLVQCKKYRGKVGEPIVRDFYGALRSSEATAGAIVTTGEITDQARLWAEGKPLFLYDGHEFMKVLQSTRLRNSLPVEARQDEQPATPAAPVIQNPLQPAYESVYGFVPSFSVAAGKDASPEVELQDKTPFMDLSNLPDCPACGTPMILKKKRWLLFGTRKNYICSNAPACPETRPINF